MKPNYTIGVITDLVELKAPLRACTIDVGSESPVTVVTNAKNVRTNSRVVVAMIGATVHSGGAEIEIKSTMVGGTKSAGMLCDEKMLDWGTTVGVAVQAPDSLPIGGDVPDENPNKPRNVVPEATAAAAAAEPGLFDKKLSKEEKKALAAQKRAAKKAAAKE